MTLELCRISDIRSLWVPSKKVRNFLIKIKIELDCTYTRSVLSAEPVAIRVPSGFHAMQRNLPAIWSANVIKVDMIEGPQSRNITCILGSVDGLHEQYANRTEAWTLPC